MWYDQSFNRSEEIDKIYFNNNVVMKDFKNHKTIGVGAFSRVHLVSYTKNNQIYYFAIKILKIQDII